MIRIRLIGFPLKKKKKIQKLIEGYEEYENKICYFYLLYTNNFNNFQMENDQTLHFSSLREEQISVLKKMKNFEEKNENGDQQILIQMSNHEVAQGKSTKKNI